MMQPSPSKPSVTLDGPERDLEHLGDFLQASSSPGSGSVTSPAMELFPQFALEECRAILPEVQFPEIGILKMALFPTILTSFQCPDRVTFDWQQQATTASGFSPSGTEKNSRLPVQIRSNILSGWRGRDIQ